MSRPLIRPLLVALATGWCMASAHAHGGATCDSGPADKWQPQPALEKQLTEQGWKVRRIRVDGGCYEVYALDDKGQRVEVYFHPLTLQQVPSKHH